MKAVNKRKCMSGFKSLISDADKKCVSVSHSFVSHPHFD